MIRHSAIYEGWVSHRRHAPRKHHFRYRQGMLYVDLEEVPEVFDDHPLWSARGPAAAWFRRADYLGPDGMSLAEAVRDEIERRRGLRPGGPVRVLTHPRYWGVCFNPVSFYYVFSADGERVEWIVADVTNTPWGQKHAYVLGPFGDPDERGTWRPVTPKEFHVSPFLGLDMDYRWRLTPPGEKLLVSIENHDNDGRLFDATFSLRRRPLDRAGLDRLVWGYPWQTVKVVGGIYWQALRLWLKRIPYVPHPGTRDGRRP